MHTDELLLRLAAVEDRMRRLQNEVDSIRSALHESDAVVPVEKPLLRTPAPEPFPPVRPPAPFPSVPPPAPRPPRVRREFDLAELLGAQALA